MRQMRRQQGMGLLWTTLLAAAAYAGTLAERHRVTMWPWLDGSIGVLLGLFICSRGASVLVDTLFEGRGRSAPVRVGWPRSEWLSLTLSLLVLLIGASIIATGAIQFVRVARHS